MKFVPGMLVVENGYFDFALRREGSIIYYLYFTKEIVSLESNKSCYYLSDDGYLRTDSTKESWVFDAKI